LGITVADLPLILGTVLTLVFLEGLLSADNALVLAVMVRHLPKDQQKRALRYGIWGAFVFRLIAILLASKLLDYWHFKVVGGLYLLYLAVAHFLSSVHEEGSTKSTRFGSGFWGTVVSVELADIAFSIDSILAALAMAESLERLGENWKLGTVYLGGILGIITMRFVAGYFIILLDRFSGLAAGAYILVAWIGLKLIGSGLHDYRHDLPLEMPEWFFWGGMLLILAASLIYKPRVRVLPPEGLAEVARIEELIDGAPATEDTTDEDTTESRSAPGQRGA
jgi:YkoY family integral membrane protein